MCEFCTKHGDGQVWFKNAANYGRDLASDLRRRGYIKEFFTSTIEDIRTLVGKAATVVRLPCAFQAITSRPTADGQRAAVSPLQCYGCGLCRDTCPTDALSMTERRHPD